MQICCQPRNSADCEGVKVPERTEKVPRSYLRPGSLVKKDSTQMEWRGVLTGRPSGSVRALSKRLHGGVSNSKPGNASGSA